jgi:2-polyprenyl-6-methoxyphenol hydroxylase-like FAD-dependent oxidoreductase
MQAEPDFIAAMINRFVGAVREDQDRTVSATDMLSTLFAQRGLLLDLPRDLALAGLDTMSPLRRYIARRGTGVGSQLRAGRQSS